MSMRVLITTDAVGGVWVYTLDLVAALRPALEIELAVVGPAPGPAQMAASRAAGARLHVTGLPLDWTASSADELAGASRHLAALARRLAVDLVQLHTPALVGHARWPAPVVAVLHSCVGTWWRAMRGGLAPPPDFSWRMAAVRVGLETADAVIAPTRALADAAQTVYATSRAFAVVHNTRRPPSIRRAAGGEGVIAAGRLWDEAKNIALLDQAAALMQGVTVRAAGAAAGPNGAMVCLTSITLLGELTRGELDAALASARIFASPARYEPFGLAVLEAAQMGLALVLADTPGFRELWDEAAVFLPPDHPASWAAALTALHARPREAEAWGARALARSAYYDGALFARRMHEIYETMLPAPRTVVAA